MSEIELLNRMVEREKLARKEAETLMEQKSRELYAVNQGLRQMAEGPCNVGGPQQSDRGRLRRF